MADLTFEKISDIAPIKELYKIVYPKRNAEKFDWLTGQNPSGPALSYCALAEGTVVGCVQVIPQEIRLHDQTYPIGQLIDGMVLKEYRGRQIFNSLVKEVMRDLQGRFEFVIGFPNDLSIGPCLNAGFEILAPMSTFVLPLSGRYIGRRVTSVGFIQALASVLAAPLVSANHAFRKQGTACELRSHQGSIPAPVADTLAGISIPHPVGLVRSPAYLHWRFMQAPTERYEFLEITADRQTVGYAVVRNRPGDREIVDIVLPEDHSILTGAMQALADHSRAAGFDSLQIQCPPSNYFADRLRQAGFRELEKTASIIYLPFSDRARNLRPEHYFLTHADSDWI